ncbi:hypothetical protein WN943_006678 [Citrus x changshan-huyou]
MVWCDLCIFAAVIMRLVGKSSVSRHFEDRLIIMSEMHDEGLHSPALK